MSTCKNVNKIKLCSLVALAFAALAIILRTSCLLWFYDAEIGYYAKSALPAVLEVFCVLAAVMFAGVFFLKPSDKTSDGKEDNLALKISSAVAVLAFAVFFVYSVASTSLVIGNSVFDLMLKVSALVAIVYFAMNLFAPINRVVQTALGFGVIIWCISVLATTYFDIYVQFNSPEKVILHLALVSCMAFLVSEFRCFVGGKRSKIYLFTAFCAVFFSGTSSIPFVIAFLCGAVNNDKYLLYNVALVALFVYSVARLISFSFARVECEQTSGIAESESASDII